MQRAISTAAPLAGVRAIVARCSRWTRLGSKPYCTVSPRHPMGQLHLDVYFGTRPAISTAPLMKVVRPRVTAAQFSGWIQAGKKPYYTVSLAATATEQVLGAA